MSNPQQILALVLTRQLAGTNKIKPIISIKAQLN